MVERWLTGAHARLRALPAVANSKSLPARRHTSFLRTHAEARSSEDSRTRRLAVYEAVRRRHLAGKLLLRISRTLRLARGTVRKYASAQTFPERAARVPGPSILDPHLEYLTQRHAAGSENARALWREIRTRGFRGTSRQVHRWLQSRRRTAAPTKPRVDVSGDLGAAGRRPDALASPKQPAWLFVKPPSNLTDADAVMLARLEQDKEAARVLELTRRFCEIVRVRSVTHGARLRSSCRPFEAWLSQALRCVLKRQMYGRASFDLLRRRVLLTV